MNVVLVALGPSAPGDAMVAGVQALQRAGARVVLVSRQPPSPSLLDALDAAGPVPPGGATAGVRSALAAALNRVPKVRLDPDRLPAAWRISRAPATRPLLDAAQVLVAVDRAAVPAVWLAARRHPQAAALSGLPAAVARYGT